MKLIREASRVIRVHSSKYTLNGYPTYWNYVTLWVKINYYPLDSPTVEDCHSYEERRERLMGVQRAEDSVKKDGTYCQGGQRGTTGSMESCYSGSPMCTKLLRRT